MKNPVPAVSSQINFERLQSHLCSSERGQQAIQQLRQIEALAESLSQPVPHAKPVPRAQVTFPYRSNQR